ncbi:NAD(P)/FAD-dependent oxidoreductase [Amnibacterium kyonggiense]|uniref:NADH dehydrogenase n=1 Tax=Amnibacterium kyonggiense TaxID=595671 RepID=A0A4R7FKM6_9MICO|nr:FAD-dependent oxidoreductase [Amnibacterium kyonggiense]TDS76941.1 NADH dehydrogenase [Amnibacterium kyonggiense]
MKRIVILGGGYSSVWCYRAIRRWMGASARITVVAPFREHVFHGFTGEVLEGGLKPEMLVSPLDEVIPRAERVQGWATAVDPDRRTVTVEWQGETRVVSYDELVVATGAQDRIDHLPGLAEHGWSLRSPGRVEALLEHLDWIDRQVPEDAEDARRATTIVVVGAGFAGTEVAAALGRRYGDARRIVLISGSRTVVPVWQDKRSLQDRLQRNLRDAGVELLTETRVVAVDEHGVELGDGSRIEAATVVSSLGSTVPVIPGLERFQEPDGLLAVDECLRVTDGVWSAGDVAAVRRRGDRVPKEALWAIRAGTTVGRNIARRSRRAEARRFGFRGLGTVAAFAPGRAVAMLWGIPLPQLVGWLVRGAFFLWYMPSRRTALSIVRWTLGRRLPVAVPVVTGPIPRPNLVGLAGGRSRAAALRDQAAPDRVAAEQPRRAAGA